MRKACRAPAASACAAAVPWLPAAASALPAALVWSWCGVLGSRCLVFTETAKDHIDCLVLRGVFIFDHQICDCLRTVQTPTEWIKVQELPWLTLLTSTFAAGCFNCCFCFDFFNGRLLQVFIPISLAICSAFFFSTRLF